MKRGFTLEIINGEYCICENGRIYRRLGKISREQAEFEFDQLRMWLDIK